MLFVLWLCEFLMWWKGWCMCVSLVLGMLGLLFLMMRCVMLVDSLMCMWVCLV